MHISKDDFIEEGADLIDKHFPKGESSERGQAMVLLAEIAQLLMKKGLIRE